MTHCQICGRLIKSSKGLIAHHGYRRPSQGWQTASCYGARHLPYEVSRDVIPLAIQSAEAYVERATKELAELVANPPAQMTHMVYNYQRGGKVPMTVTRPEGFNAHDQRPVYNPAHAGYNLAFRLRHSGLRDGILQTKGDIAYLNERFAKWVAPS